MEHAHLPVKPGLLRRSGIDAILQNYMSCSLVTVVAGPGYGKTQAVASYVQRIKQRLIWISLTELDNDISHFWNTFITAVSMELPVLAANYKDQGFPKMTWDYDRHIKNGVRAIYQDKGVVMVVDNYCRIHNKSVRRFIEGFIRLNVENFCAILVSSNKEDQSIGWELVGANHINITASELAFSKDETRRFLHSQGIDLSEHRVDEIVTITEGWPMAIYLMSTRLNDMEISLGSSVIHINNLFNLRYYADYKPAYQELLVGLSLLPGFTLHMLKTIDENGIDDMVRLIESNVFINYNFNTQLFSFHRLYQDFLSQKQYMLDEHKRRRFYTVAGDFFLEANLLLESMECYFHCGMFDRMMETISRYPAARTDVTLSNYTMSFLEKLPEDYTQSHLRVDFSKGYLYLNNMEVKRALSIFESILNKLESKPQTEEEEWLIGETYAALGDIHMLRNTDKFVEYYKKADQHLPDGSIFHGLEIMAVDNNEIFFLPGQEKGQLESIVKKVFESSAHMERALNGQGYGFEWLFSAGASYCTYDFATAENHCYQAIYKAKTKKQHDIVCNALFLLAKIEMMRGKYTAAVGHLKKIDSYVIEQKALCLQETADFVQSWFYLMMGEAAKVHRWVAEDDNIRGDTQPIGVGRNKLLHASYLHEKQRDVEAVAYLSQLEVVYEEKGLWTTRLRHHILKAICYMALSLNEDAVREFSIAYEMTNQNKIITPFIEHGSDMVRLIEIARADTSRRFRKEWIDKVSKKASIFAARHVRMVRKYRSSNKTLQHNKVVLSKRESDVLRLIAEGLTRDEMGKRLNISVNSIKRYISGLYNKLGAVNRVDAIRIAMIRGDLSVDDVVE